MFKHFQTIYNSDSDYMTKLLCSLAGKVMADHWWNR